MISSKKIALFFCFVLQFFLFSPVLATTMQECLNVTESCANKPEAEQVQCYKAAEECAASATDRKVAPSTDERGTPDEYYDESKRGVPGLLPACAFNASGCTGKDADINIFVELGINIAKFMFAIIGTVAFVMFVYGGFTMILAFGSADKFKQGKDILVAAVVGMMIAFGAYILVDFVLDVLQVGEEFRVIK